MRLWTISPRYLDSKGLVAAWREGLLALKVLRGGTNGYRNHPQLERFRSVSDPVALARRFLAAIADEADVRGYRFDRSRLGPEAAEPDGKGKETARKLPVASGQIRYELELLLFKLETRDPERRRQILESIASSGTAAAPGLNPVFREVPGDIAAWERVIPGIAALPPEGTARSRPG